MTLPLEIPQLPLHEASPLIREWKGARGTILGFSELNRGKLVIELLRSNKQTKQLQRLFLACHDIQQLRFLSSLCPSIDLTLTAMTQQKDRLHVLHQENWLTLVCYGVSVTENFDWAAYFSEEMFFRPPELLRDVIQRTEEQWLKFGTNLQKQQLEKLQNKNWH